MYFNNPKTIFLIALTCFAHISFTSQFITEYEEKAASALRNGASLSAIAQAQLVAAQALEGQYHSSSASSSAGSSASSSDLSSSILSGSSSSSARIASSLLCGSVPPTQQTIDVKKQAALKKQFDTFITAKSGTQEFKQLRDAIKSQIEKRLAGNIPSLHDRLEIIHTVFETNRSSKIHSTFGIHDDLFHEMVTRLFYHTVAKKARIGGDQMPAAVVAKNFYPFYLGTQQKIAQEFLPAIGRKINFKDRIEKIYLAPNGSYFIVNTANYLNDSVHLYDHSGVYQNFSMKCAQDLFRDENTDNVFWSPDSQCFVVRRCYPDGNYFTEESRLYTVAGTLQSRLPTGTRYYWRPDSQVFIVQFWDDTACLYNKAGQPQWHDTITDVQGVSWRPDSQGFIILGKERTLYRAIGQQDLIVAGRSPKHIYWQPDSAGFMAQHDDNNISFYNSAGQQQNIHIGYHIEHHQDSPTLVVQFDDGTTKTYTVPMSQKSTTYTSDNGTIISSYKNSLIVQLPPKDAYNKLRTCTFDQLEFIRGIFLAKASQQNSLLYWNRAFYLTKQQSELRRNCPPHITQNLESNYQPKPHQSWCSWLGNNCCKIGSTVTVFYALAVLITLLSLNQCK